MGDDMFNDEQLAHAKAQAIQYDPACVDCRQDAAKDRAGTTWQCAGHVRAERDWLRARLANVMAEADHDIAVLTTERNAALTLAEKRGAAYDMTWREVESLRERLDKSDEERGRQFGLRVRAEEETERLISLVKEWLDGNARLGRPKSIADQRFLNGLNAEVRDSRQTEKAKDSEPPLRAENERLRKELQGVANHLLSMSGGAHNCAGCGFLHKQIVRALAAPPEEK